MILVASPTSPFARKIRVQLLEKNLPFELHATVPWDADTDVKQYNPLGKVPALVDDKQRHWVDSPVIAEYIETLPSAIRLVPTDPLAAVKVRQIEALADGVCEAAIAIFLEKKRDPAQQSESWIARQQEKVDAGIKALDKHLSYNEWMCHSYSLADITVVSVLEWYSFRFPHDNWKKQYPKLAGYIERVGERESFKQTRPS